MIQITQKFSFAKLLSLIFCIGLVSCELVPLQSFNSNENIIANHIRQLLDSDFNGSTIGFIRNDIDLRAKDIIQEILTKFGIKKTIVLGKYIQRQSKLDILVYFTLKLNEVSMIK